MRENDVDREAAVCGVPEVVGKRFERGKRGVGAKARTGWLGTTSASRDAVQNVGILLVRYTYEASKQAPEVFSLAEY